jgi:hypothetical protein
MPEMLQGAIDEMGAMIAPLANSMSYNIITGHRVSPVGADPGISRHYRFLNSYQKGGRLVNGVSMIAGFFAPESWFSRAAVAEGQMTTVLGSGRDVARYAGRPGFNVLDMSKIPEAEWARTNAEWLNASLRRGDNIWLVTDPARHTQLMQSLGKSSYYLDLELPMLEEFNASALLKYNPVSR